MNIEPLEDMPPFVLRSDDLVGLYVYADDSNSEELRECLEDDEVDFTLNPHNAGHLARPGKVVFMFGKEHPRVVVELLELVGAKVAVDPGVVFNEEVYYPPVKQLLSLGEVQREEQRDYCGLGLSLNDVPSLIRMATDYQLHGGPQGSPVVWAPVHAWRTLAQLRAPEALGPLVGLFPRADAQDDWVSDDLPKAVAQFGAVAIDPVAGFLADATRGDWARTAAAKTLGEVGKRHPELRMGAIRCLAAQLDRFAEQSDTLNGMLVSELWDLKAVEAMPVIERAFASGRVDESINGDVEDVQIHFGLKSNREHPPKPNKLTIMAEEFRVQWQAAGLPLPDADGNFPPLSSGADDFLESDFDLPAVSEPYIAPPKVGRNEPCPCGSGKKYKKCCGA